MPIASTDSNYSSPDLFHLARLISDVVSLRPAGFEDCHRAGELRAVWVPDDEQEAMRDLTRAREDMKSIEPKARQRLGAFMLRHDRVYEGLSRWTHVLNLELFRSCCSGLCRA